MNPTPAQLTAMRERCEREAHDAFEAGFFDGYMGRENGPNTRRYNYSVLQSAYSAGYGAGTAARPAEKPQ